MIRPRRGRWSWPRPLFLAWTFAGALPSVALAAVPDSTAAAREPHHSWITRGDAWFAAASVASVALATHFDRWGEDEAPEESGSLALTASYTARRLADPRYLVPAFLLVRAADALEGRSDRAASVMRIAEGAAAAGAAAGLVKIAVGRSRPYQSPRDQDVLHPFSGNTAFPSGHTALAFGVASAIDRETSARWVPWVVYPLAGLVGWSRVRDDRHWTSDVVAGAALGYWTAREVVDLARRKVRAP